MTLMTRDEMIVELRREAEYVEKMTEASRAK